LCEAFPGLSPTQILAERARLPEGFLEEIIASRQYARAVAANTVDPKSAGSSAIRQRALVITFELAQEEIDQDG
jgi:hypothetical protein